MALSKNTIRVGESLDLDLDDETWCCHACAAKLGPASENFKRGLLVYDRDPREIHRPLIDGPFSFAPNGEWIRILEFYCPACGTQIETEYLPPGHPITNTTEIDVKKIKQRLERGEILIEDAHLKVVEA